MKREPSRREKALAEDFAKGLQLHRKGQLGRAELYYRKVLTTEPQHFDALHLLGVVEGQNGNFDAALELLQRAVALRPEHPAALNNFGNTLGSLKRHEEALAAFDRSLAQRPDDAKALRNRGTTLRALKRSSEALESFERALALQPGFADAIVSRAETLQDLGRLPEAIDAFRDALEHGKDGETIRYALAALGDEPLPSTAPPSYVTGLFDGYSDSFDAHLVGTLNYRTPALLVELLKRFTSGPADIVDLGCGTGLCAPLLRPLAKRLVGVDLSGGMLAKAREAGHYDTLERVEVAAYLDGQPQAFDIAVAADVFVYIGDLAAVFAAVRKALRPGGLFAFSVEAISDADYVLRPTRRFAHSAAYLERLAAKNGLGVEAIEHQAIREDRGGNVDGLLVLLRHTPAQ